MKFVLLLFLFYLLWSVEASENETCIHYEYDTVPYTHLNYTSFKTQSFQIGLLGSFGNLYNLFWLMFRTAIDMINNDNDILQDVRLEAYLSELQGDDVNALVATESLIQINRVRAIVGPLQIDETKITQLLAQIFQVPQVVPLQIEAVLGTSADVFMARVIPSDAIQGRAIANFAYLQKWRQLMVTYSNDIRSISALQELQMAVAAYNITIHALQVPSDPAQYSSYVWNMMELMRQYRLRITVHLTVITDATSLFPLLMESNIIGDPKFAHILCCQLAVYARVAGTKAPWATGSIGLIPMEAAGPMYEEFSKIWKTKSTEPGFDPNPRVKWYVLDAFFAVVFSLDRLLKSGVPLDLIDGKMHLEAMKNLTFMGITGEVKLNAKGERVGGYNWFNFVSEFEKVTPVAVYNELVGRNTSILGPIQFSKGATSVYDGVCECKYGGCGGDGPECTCEGGYTGTFCDKRNDKFQQWLLSIIIVVPSVACLVIAIYAYRCVVTKRAMAIKDVTDRQRSVIRRSDITLNQPIGKGASGVVWRGMLRGTEVAVKKLIAHDVSQNVVQAFELESAVMAGLRHPCIVLFMGSCIVPEEKEMLLVMEYMEKGSLHDILHNPNVDFPFELALHIAIQAAKGMNFLHESSPPIIHRDLKSHNILLDDKWNARIADFGIARIKDISSKKGKGDQAIGTIFWTAPEIFLGQSNTEKSDCYSFGIVLWELVHRENPYNDKDVMTVAYEVSRSGLRLPITASVPPRYKELIETCWDQTPEKRPSFHHITQTLRQLSHSYPLTHFRSHNSHNDAPAGFVVFVRTRVRGSNLLWEQVPNAMLYAITLQNQLLRSMLSTYEGYEVNFDHDKGGEGEKDREREGFLFAFEGVGSALNFCLNAQVALLQVAWPPAILSYPVASQVFKSVGRKLWNGLRVRMAIHAGNPSTSVDPVSGRTKYFGHVVDKTPQLLAAAPKSVSIITSDIVMNKINTHNIKFTEDIKCDPCGVMVDSSRRQEPMHSVLPLSLSSRSRFYSELSVAGPNGELQEEYIQATPPDEAEDDLPWIIPFSAINLKENVGKGPIGDYFRATWKNKEVAVKELINQKLQENDILYLKAKVSSLSKIKHKNLMDVFGICFERGHISLITEYMTKCNLRQVLDNDFVPLTWKTKLRIAQQIADGMSYLVTHPDPDIHIHENLKSGNIHVNVDRGIVKITDHGQGVLRDLARTMTSVDNIAWTAPEVLSGEAATPAISIYSFGIILYEIATRRAPYPDEHPVLLVEKVLDGMRPSNIPQCPPGYKELMEECWDANPENRPTWSYCAHTLAVILKANNK